MELAKMKEDKVNDLLVELDQNLVSSKIISNNPNIQNFDLIIEILRELTFMFQMLEHAFKPCSFVTMFPCCLPKLCIREHEMPSMSCCC